MNSFKDILKSYTNPALFIGIAVVITLILASILASISLFIKSDENQNNARLVNQAVIESASIAETLKACNGNLSKAGELLTAHQLIDTGQDSMTLHYDEDLKPVAQSESPYKAHITKSSADGCFEYDINITDSETGGEIYRLTFKAVKRRDAS